MMKREGARTGRAAGVDQRGRLLHEAQQLAQGAAT